MTNRPRGDASTLKRARPRARPDVSDLIDDVRPATARSILATALLGASTPSLSVSSLLAVTRLFDISSGATRTCLSRMVSDGELTTERGIYSLTGRLLDRRQQIDRASRAEHTGEPWDGTWELNVVILDKRDAMPRHEMRKAATALHLAELREGIWARPDNLPHDREPAARAIVAQQCITFRNSTTTIEASTIAEVFDLAAWSTTARRLLEATHHELAAAKAPDLSSMDLQHQFNLSMAVVAHLQRDPVLPHSLVPSDWPAELLRTTYRTLDSAFQRAMAAIAERSIA